MGNDSPPHLSPNLHLNLEIKMPKRKSRSEMGLLNPLQQGAREEEEGNEVRQGRLEAADEAEEGEQGEAAEEAPCCIV